MQCAVNYDSDMHKALAYIVVLFFYYHLEVTYIKNVAQYLKTFSTLICSNSNLNKVEWKDLKKNSYHPQLDSMYC